MADTPHVHSADARNFNDLVIEGSRSVPVLVDFWADWCQPCHMLMPAIAKLAEEYADRLVVVKVDTEQERDLAAHFGVRSLPTVKLFRDGQPVDEFMGALPESEIRAFLERHLPRESDAMVARAEERLQEGDAEGALALARQAQESDPTNPRALAALARIQAAGGDPASALATLAELPAEERDNPEVAELRARLGFEGVAGAAPSPDTLEARLKRSPEDSEARYQLAAHRVLAGDYEGALEHLMTLLARDRAYGDDAARRAILEVFGLLGGSGELVKRYRTRLFNALH